MSGNLYEWVQDCYHASYNGAPTDGRAGTVGQCDLRMLRGGGGLATRRKRVSPLASEAAPPTTTPTTVFDLPGLFRNPPTAQRLGFDTIRSNAIQALKVQNMSRRPSVVLRENRDLIRGVALRHRTENLRVFGSVLRGEDTEGSDLDLLVDPLPGATLLDLGAIQIELEESLGIHVDVLTPADLPEKFRRQVLTEAVSV